MIKTPSFRRLDQRAIRARIGITRGFASSPSVSWPSLATGEPRRRPGGALEPGNGGLSMILVAGTRFSHPSTEIMKAGPRQDQIRGLIACEYKMLPDHESPATLMIKVAR